MGGNPTADDVATFLEEPRSYQLGPEAILGRINRIARDLEHIEDAAALRAIGEQLADVATECAERFREARRGQSRLEKERAELIAV